jgi:predicted HD phosphohydrolase
VVARAVGDETQESERYPAADAILLMLGLMEGRKALEHGREGVDGLSHALQVATRAERDGAHETMVVAALCHDLGKLFSVARHDRISATLIEGYVPLDVAAVIRHHIAFTARHWNGSPFEGRWRYRTASWYRLAEQFVDEWDVPSFDREYPSHRLDHFEGAVRRVFDAPRWPSPGRLPRSAQWLRPIINTAREVGRQR